MRLLLSILAASFLLLAAITAAPNEQKEIQDLYRRGLGGDKIAVEQCLAKLEATLTTEPKNQLARVYLGSTYTLRSRDLGFGPAKLQALRHGLALMDEAVTAEPESPKIRLARALTTASLPAFFGRRAQSRSDLEQLGRLAQQSPGKFEADDLEIIQRELAKTKYPPYKQSRIDFPLPAL